MKSIKNNNLSFFDHYTIDRKTPNSDETVLKDKSTNTYVLMKQITIANKNDFKRIVETLQGQRGLKNDHLLSLIDYETRSQVKFQGTCHKLITFHQYSSHNLLEQINARIEEQRQFEQYQVWSILCSIVFALSYLQKQNIGHGCISPYDIYLSSEGVIKVADPSIATSSPFIMVEGYYYSPQIFEYFGRQINEQDIDIFKSDVFSLGMCMLQVCSLNECQQCYDYEEISIQTEKLKQKFNSLIGIYSKDLLDIIYAMLDFDILNRPNFIQLQQKLRQFLRNQKYDGLQQMSLSISKDIKNFNQSFQNVSNIIQDHQDQPNILSFLPQLIDLEKRDISDYQFQKSILNYSLKNQIYQHTQQQNQNCFIFDQSTQNNPKYLNKNIESQLTTDIQNNFNIDNNVDEQKPQDKNFNIDQNKSLEKKQSNKLQIQTNRNIIKNKQVQNNPINQTKITSNFKEIKSATSNQSSHQVYTDPNLLKMMKDDVEKILIRRSNLQKNLGSLFYNVR